MDDIELREFPDGRNRLDEEDNEDEDEETAFVENSLRISSQFDGILGNRDIGTKNVFDKHQRKDLTPPKITRLKREILKEVKEVGYTPFAEFGPKNAKLLDCVKLRFSEKTGLINGLEFRDSSGNYTAIIIRPRGKSEFLITQNVSNF